MNVGLYTLEVWKLTIIVVESIFSIILYTVTTTDMVLPAISVTTFYKSHHYVLGGSNLYIESH